MKYMTTPVNRAREFLNSGSRNRQRALQLFSAVLNSQTPNNSVLNRLANIITPVAPLGSNRSYTIRSPSNNSSSNSNNNITSRNPNNITVNRVRSFLNSGSRNVQTARRFENNLLSVRASISNNLLTNLLGRLNNITRHDQRQSRRNLLENFNAANTNMNRIYREAVRLSSLNLNTFGVNNRRKARLFITSVINAQNGNENSYKYALSVVNNVKRIGGGNIPENRRQTAHRAATTIQKYARGIAGRKRAAARGSRFVRLPNGSYMVAVPTKRRR